ncbi:hypothetical protein [Streptomyces sp. NPDC090025]|uniref:hypothetical protein n=1 Tax=Streptomyces sp. NPDC090025 TaxID=3365922 RepID=UPI003832340E
MGIAATTARRMVRAHRPVLYAGPGARCELLRFVAEFENIPVVAGPGGPAFAGLAQYLGGVGREGLADRVLREADEVFDATALDPALLADLPAERASGPCTERLDWWARITLWRFATRGGGGSGSGGSARARAHPATHHDTHHSTHGDDKEGPRT